jgi:hypothetical protein
VENGSLTTRATYVILKKSGHNKQPPNGRNLAQSGQPGLYQCRKLYFFQRTCTCQEGDGSLQYSGQIHLKIRILVTILQVTNYDLKTFNLSLSSLEVTHFMPICSRHGDTRH